MLRYYDFTPVSVAFGKLQSVLMPHARYFRHDGQSWQLAPYDELSRRCGQWQHLRSGVLEFMAQACSFHYCRPSGKAVNKNVYCPPMVMPRASASVTFRALKVSVSEFSLEKILTMAQTLPYIFYCDGPDNASANSLKKRHLAAALLANVFVVDEGCSAHKINRTLGNVIEKRKTFTGDVHVVSFISSQANYMRSFDRALWSLIGRELVVRYDALDVEWANHASAIMATHMCATMSPSRAASTMPSARTRARRRARGTRSGSWSS